MQWANVLTQLLYGVSKRCFSEYGRLNGLDGGQGYETGGGLGHEFARLCSTAGLAITDVDESSCQATGQFDGTARDCGLKFENSNAQIWMDCHNCGYGGASRNMLAYMAGHNSESDVFKFNVAESDGSVHIVVCMAVAVRLLNPEVILRCFRKLAEYGDWFIGNAQRKGYA